MLNNNTTDRIEECYMCMYSNTFHMCVGINMELNNSNYFSDEASTHTNLNLQILK